MPNYRAHCVSFRCLELTRGHYYLAPCPHVHPCTRSSLFFFLFPLTPTLDPCGSLQHTSKWIYGFSSLQTHLIVLIKHPLRHSCDYLSNILETLPTVTNMCFWAQIDTLWFLVLFQATLSMPVEIAGVGKIYLNDCKEELGLTLLSKTW